MFKICLRSLLNLKFQNCNNSPILKTGKILIVDLRSGLTLLGRAVVICKIQQKAYAK